MDGEAPGTSQWLNIWMIDNGAAPAGLVSTSATAPTFQAGTHISADLVRCELTDLGIFCARSNLGLRLNTLRRHQATQLPSPTIISGGGSITLWTANITGNFYSADRSRAEFHDAA